MTVVFSEERVSLRAQARMAELELVAARSRRLWKAEMERCPFTDRQRAAAVELAEIDRLLDGTIHSFTKGATR